VSKTRGAERVPIRRHRPRSVRHPALLRCDARANARRPRSGRRRPNGVVRTWSKSVTLEGGACRHPHLRSVPSPSAATPVQESCLPATPRSAQRLLAITSSNVTGSAVSLGHPRFLITIRIAYTSRHRGDNGDKCPARTPLPRLSTSLRFQVVAQYDGGIVFHVARAVDKRHDTSAYRPAPTTACQVGPGVPDVGSGRGRRHQGKSGSLCLGQMSPRSRLQECRSAPPPNVRRRGRIVQVGSGDLGADRRGTRWLSSHRVGQNAPLSPC
jgi:hypothetical protein